VVALDAVGSSECDAVTAGSRARGRGVGGGGGGGSAAWMQLAAPRAA
jgi:hypothetical protein